MNRFILAFILIMFLVPTAILHALKASHNQIIISNENDNQLVLSIDETDSDISRIVLYYKSDKDLNYNSIELLNENSSMNSFSFLVQSAIDEVMRKDSHFFEYYLKIMNQNGIELSLPQINPELNPYKSTIQRETFDDAFVLISPDDLSDLVEGQNIVISFYNVKDHLNRSSINVKLNGKNMGSNVTIDDALLIIKLPGASKENKLNVSATLDNGQKIESPSWDFTKIKKLSAFDYYGNLTLLANSNNYSNYSDSLGLDSSDEQAGIFQFTGLYKWMILKNYLLFSSLEDSQSQKINKYYLGFLMPYFDLHLGDYSPNYSEFTVYNRSVDGVSATIKTELFRFALTSGKISRTVNPKDISLTDTYRAFDRDHLSAKVTFGNSNSFALSLNMAKSKDKVNSLNKEAYEISDSVSTEYLIQAKDNFVIGSDLQWHMFSRKFTLFAEVAMSIYNSNIIPGVMTKDSLESFIDDESPIDPEAFEPLIVINKNMEPFGFGLNNMAIKTGFNLNILKNNLTVSYNQTGPSFYSLSSTGIIQDKRIIRVMDNFILSNNFFISGGYELTSDNTVDQKDFTLSNQSYFVNFNYSPNNLPYFSMNFINNANSDDRPDSLSTRIDTNSQYMQFTTGYSYKFLPFAYTTSSISYGMGFDQDNSSVKLYDNKKNDIGLNTTFRFNDFPLTTKIGLNINTSNEKSTQDLTLKYNSFYLNNEYALFDNKLIPFLNFRTNMNSGDQNESRNLLFSTGTKYYPFKKTWLSADISYKTYTEDNPVSDKDYNLLISRFLISTSF